MKQLALAVLFIAGLASSAQANQIMLMTAACQQANAVEDFIRDEYQEVPFAKGTGVIRLENGNYAQGFTKIYLNLKDRGFTVVIEFPQEDVHCIMLMGDKFAPVIPGADT